MKVRSREAIVIASSGRTPDRGYSRPPDAFPTGRECPGEGFLFVAACFLILIASPVATNPDPKNTLSFVPLVHPQATLQKLSVIIPARDEEGCIASTVRHLHLELELHKVPHEIVVVDDGSTDRTWEILLGERERIKELSPVQNLGLHGFGRAIEMGLNLATGDAVVIMMADESDDCRDVVRYWQKLNEGYECVFGSRFVKGGGTIDYPPIKFALNRLANLFIKTLFHLPLNDTTNAFKAYRKTVIDGVRPIFSPHFNITVELPLKAVIRGFKWTVIPITWRNRRHGVAKLKINEMGSRYFFIVAYVWLEKYFSRGDYRKQP